MGLGKGGEKAFGVRRSAFGAEALEDALVTLVAFINGISPKFFRVRWSCRFDYAFLPWLSP